MRTALVVDDSPIDLLMGKTLLEKLGYVVLRAATAEEAIRIIHEETPFIVISDITMPGASGLDLLKEAQQLQRPPIFIMATGLDDAQNAIAALQQGAYGYITKPLKEDLLRQTIHDAMLKRGKETADEQAREDLSKRDPLTGLFNKDQFMRLLKEQTTSSRKKIGRAHV